MLAFAVCLVFGAHPDFWLSDAEFEAKYCKTQVARVRDQYSELKDWRFAVAQAPR